MKHIFDISLFAFTLMFGQFMSLQGKTICSFIFSSGENIVNPNLNLFSINLITIFTCLVYASTRYLKIPVQRKAIYLASLGFLASLAPQILSISNSPLIFSLQLYLYAISTYIILVNSYIYSKMQSDFWKILLSSNIKAVQFVLALFVAGSAILRFVSQRNGESTISFMTTLIYPIIVIATSFCLLSYWVIYPCWENLVESYKFKE